MTELKSTTTKEQLEEIEHIKKARLLSDKTADIKIAMLSTTDASGETTSSPMYTFKIEDDGLIWLFAAKDSAKVSNIRLNGKVLLNYADPAHHLYISVRGTAGITEDSVRIKEMWSSRYNEWFAYGEEDPNICLIRIEPYSFEYWDTPDLLVSQLISLARNTLQGNPYVEGENKKLDM